MFQLTRLIVTHRAVALIAFYAGSIKSEKIPRESFQEYHINRGEQSFNKSRNVVILLESSEAAGRKFPDLMLMDEAGEPSVFERNAAACVACTFGVAFSGH